MRGDAGVPLVFHCGSRNAGWLGSFQIEYSVTREAKCRPTAVMNSWKSFGSGFVTYGAFLFDVAQRGTGEVTVKSTFQPLACASEISLSYSPQA